MIACAHCGTTMATPTGRAARKRYCSDDCRKAAWRRRHRHDDTPAPAAVPAVRTASHDVVPNPNAQHHCPRCRTPLAILTVVIPADAAHINPPEVPPLDNTTTLEPPPGEDDLATLGNFDERQHRVAGAAGAPGCGWPVRCGSGLRG